MLRCEVDPAIVRVTLILFILFSCALLHSAFAAAVLVAHLSNALDLIPIIRIASLVWFLLGPLMLFMLEGRAADRTRWARLFLLAVLLSLLQFAMRGVAVVITYSMIDPHLLMIPMNSPVVGFIKYLTVNFLLLGVYRGLWGAGGTEGEEEVPA